MAPRSGLGVRTRRYGGVDPGINALSILTEILPAPVHLTRATLGFPSNRQTPIAADLAFSGNVTADFDWRQEGPQTWTIDVETDAGALQLTDGGARLLLNGAVISQGPNTEYPRLYQRMTERVTAGASDVDLAPFVHVADALMLGQRAEVEAFHF